MLPKRMKDVLHHPPHFRNDMSHDLRQQPEMKIEAK